MKITLADIAKKANVSKMTVSRVLSGKGQIAPETYRRVKKIIDEMGYHPNLIARSLASKRSMILGVVIPKVELRLLDNYIAQVLSGITDVALQNNYRILLCPVELNKSEEKYYLNIARSNLLDGMVLLKTKYDDPNIDVLSDSDFPFVLVNHKRYSKNCNFVDSRNIKGAQTAVQYLYDSGHRDIAFVAGSMNETNGKDRFKGYQDALKMLDLKYHEDWIVYGEFNQEKAYRESIKLFQGSKRPTAVFCSDDYMAIGVMNRIKEVGLSIPGDIAIIGFDDIELAAYVQPTLTTIRQPIYELGKTSAEILLNLIHGKQKTPVHKLLNIELVKRESA